MSNDLGKEVRFVLFFCMSSPLFGVHIARARYERDSIAFVDKEYCQIPSFFGLPKREINVFAFDISFFNEIDSRITKQNFLNFIRKDGVLAIYFLFVENVN